MKTERLHPIFDTDSYKASHYLQYPPGTTSMFSYIESRGGLYDKTVFFGLQYYIKEYLDNPVTRKDVDEAEKFYKDHGLPFNREGWEHILYHHRGRLPIRIRAVPEGTVVPTGNILVSIESTDPKVFWIVSWLETMLLRVWYPITVATRSYMSRQTILSALEESADDPQAEIDFKLHDFGSRGVSSQESAMIGGAAHLVNFKGSDTVAGIMCARRYYDSPMAGFSIPAAEHSSITSWRRDGEVEAYRNMLAQFAKPGAIVAIVSDSYDIYNACDNLWGKELREEVIKSGATIVIRPDSGEPAVVVLKCLSILAEKFGYTTNSKGYKVLNNVRIIQGDGINDKSIKDILKVVLYSGFSASNIAFGMGGGLLQQLDRDTQKFAMKCSSIVANGEEIDVYKQPITDEGKNSKSGRLDLEWFEGYRTVKLASNEERSPYSVMRTVFEDGELYNIDDFEAVRSRVKK